MTTLSKARPTGEDATEPQVETLRHEIFQTRRQTDLLFTLVTDETLYDRPVRQRHRLIFYLGHLEAFDWNLIGARHLKRPRFHATFDRLFEAGIDPDCGSLPQDQPSDWPSLEEVREYCRQARTAVDRLLPLADAEIVQTAIEHRLMHAETLSYLLHNLPYERKRAPGGLGARASSRVAAVFCEVPAGRATLGRQDGFGWDNEFDELEVDVPAFAVSKYKVTNGEYLLFVEQGAEPPNFWERHDGIWYRRGMFQRAPLPLDEPVYTTQEQASAFARWRGKRLLTEAEFHRAAYGTPDGVEREYPWGSEAPRRAHGNLDFHHWDPISVSASPAGASAFDIEQLVGNGWEWTSTLFAPFPGFAPRDYYPGYSKNFFDNQHFVMKGGSARTGARLLRRSFRNWFRPDYPYAYAGFRLVEAS